MISETLQRRLTIVNTVILCLIILSVLGVAAVFREQASSLVSDFIDKEIVSSRFIESVLPQDSAEEASITLPLYEIKIKPTVLRKIHVLSQRLVNQGVMLDRDKEWFPAKFAYDGRDYKVKVRLRGDYSPHWIHAKKSWRIKFKKDDMFNGYREINLVIPSDRGDENEEVAFEMARRAGLLVPASGFAQVEMNGVDMGAYFWFENNSSEMLEKLRYPEGEIIRSKNVISEKGFFPHGLSAKNFYFVQGSYDNAIRDDATAGYPMERFWQLLQLIQEGDEDVLRRRLPHYVDMEKFYKWSAIAWMFGSKHAGGIDNLRWYYDTTTGLLEPILYDVGTRFVGEKNAADWYTSIFDDYYSPVVRGILSVPDFRRGRNQVLWQMLSDDQFDPVPLSQQLFSTIKPYLMRGVRSRPSSELQENHETRLERLDHNRRYLRSKLGFAAAYANSRVLIQNGKPVLSVEVVPDTHDSIELRRLSLKWAAEASRIPRVSAVRIHHKNGETAEISDVVSRVEGDRLVLEYSDLYFDSEREADGLTLKPTPGRIDIEFAGVDEATWLQAGSIAAVSYDFVNPISGRPVAEDSMHSPPFALGQPQGEEGAPFATAAQFIASSGLPFILQSDVLMLGPGIYEVTEDLIVPVDYRLVLRAGVHLKLAPGVSILTYRAIDVQGVAGDPVIVEPLVEGKPWGSFAILNAADESTVTYLNIGGGSETWIAGAFFSGQFAFHRSDLAMSDSTIWGARADDALNVKKANARVTRTLFENNSSDAFDADWVKGSVTESVFRNNGGDGLDTSGADITLSHSLLTGMTDKAVSAGENSRILCFNNVIRDSGIGIAAKDLSKVTAYANVFYNNEAAFSLYRKKQVFGGAKARVISSLFWRNKDIVVLDEESKFSAMGIGVDNWQDKPGVDAQDVRQGIIEDHYRVGEAGDISYKGSGEEPSPFSSGPRTEAGERGGIQIPDFSNAPIGLQEPLRIAQ